MTHTGRSLEIQAALADIEGDNDKARLLRLEAENERLKKALFSSHCLQGGLDADEIEIDWDNETAVPLAKGRE